MSTTRSQKRRNNLQESSENVSEGLISLVVIENSEFLDQDVLTTEHSSAKSPRIKNSVLESLRASLREEITSEIKALLIDYQKMMMLLKPKTGESVRRRRKRRRERN